MLRLFSAPTVAAVLGLGGTAMAQDELIVDPWKHAVASVLGAEYTAPAGTDRTTRPVGVASFPTDDTTPSAPRPSVEPLGPPLNLAVDPWSATPVEPVATERTNDPWAGSRLSTGAIKSSEPVTARRGHTDWARAIDEIIDPWAKGPLAVITDPLIVDPWAR